MDCESILQVSQKQDATPLFSENAFEQWLIWEQTANVPEFYDPRKTVLLRVLKWPLSKSDVKYSAALNENIKNFFVRSEYVLGLVHPDNKSSVSAWANENTTETLLSLKTASRSVALLEPIKGFSIKVATDYPHGLNNDREPEKAQTAEGLTAALMRTEHIRNQDRILGPDDQLILLLDELSVSPKDNPNGYLLRDIRQLMDGHYYLPAFSIPYVGRQISRKHGADFFQFWSEHYSKAVGIAKAKFLLRYGLQMETPNAQNILIQLDANLKPTGRIVFRDIGDSCFVESVATAFGFESQIQLDAEAGFKTTKLLKPYSLNSLWKMNVNTGFSDWETKLLVEIQNQAYVTFILKTLNSQRTNLLDKDLPYEVMESLSKYLETREGQLLLENYRKQFVYRN